MNTYNQTDRLYHVTCDFCGTELGSDADPGEAAEKARKNGHFTVAWGKKGQPLPWSCKDCKGIKSQ